MFKCKRCDTKFLGLDALRRHVGRIHKVSSKEFFVEYHLNNKQPTCKCGCGEGTRWTGHGFDEWKRGHISRVHNNWGHNQTAIDNSSNTRRKQYKNGERKVWNDGLTKKSSQLLVIMGKNLSNNTVRSKKISDALSGVPKSDEHTKKIQTHWKRYWSNDVHKDEQRVRHIKWLCEKQKMEPSILENDFHTALKQSGVFAIRQFELGHHLFDFKIGKRLLVEVDGDFYHCNPSRGIRPQYPVQKRTVANDGNKNIIAKKFGYTLIRIWESDFRSNPQEQLQKILNEIVKQ